jgi:hypothetical protein
MRERFADANACRTAPKNVSDITSQVADCLSNNEKNNNNTFATAFALVEEIQTAKNKTANLFVLGDKMFGTSAGHVTISNEVKQRNTELRQKKTALENDNKKKYNIIHTRNRDFSDHLDATNESKLLSLEDYTVFVFIMSYLFMACIAVWCYSVHNGLSASVVGKAILAAIGTTIVGGLVAYNVF